MVHNPSKRDLNIVLMELEAAEDSPAAKAGREAGQKFLAIREAENPKILTGEQIDSHQKVTLKSGKVVLMITFGHNYGPGLQPGYRPLNSDECAELCDTFVGMPALPIFIIDDLGQYFMYDKSEKLFSLVDPNKTLTQVFGGVENEMFKSDLPFWHHYICYLPQIKLIV